MFIFVFSFFQQNAGRFSSSLFSAYAVTKYGVEAFSDALRREMNPWGVQVSIVEPGAFKTNIAEPSKVERDLKEAWQNLNEELKEEYGEGYWQAGKVDHFSQSRRPRKVKVMLGAIKDRSSNTEEGRRKLGVLNCFN